MVFSSSDRVEATSVFTFPTSVDTSPIFVFAALACSFTADFRCYGGDLLGLILLFLFETSGQFVGVLLASILAWPASIPACFRASSTSFFSASTLRRLVCVETADVS